jgi:type IV pilus assembly protein PilC
MPIYKYNGLRLDGKKVSSTIPANDPDDLKVQLKNNNILLVKYTMLKERRTNDFFAVSSRVKKDEFLSFCQEFSIMLNAGVSITDSLDTLRQQPFGTVFKNIISDVYEDVLKGVYLSDAFKKHPKAFPDFFCNMVYVGELSGNLSEVLHRTASYYEQDMKTKKKTKTAMIYPTFLLVMIVVVVFALMTFVVPLFTDMITELGGEIPLITKIVMDISNFFKNNVIAILITIACFILFLYLFNKTKKGKLTKAWLGFHFPVLRTISRNTLTARFATSFAILLSSGMTVIEAMEGLEKILGNELFASKFRYAVEEVKRGKRISRSIQNTDLFPSMLTQMVSIGEDNGSLEPVLISVGNYYTDQVNVSVAKATAIMEPVIIVILGIIVGIVIVAVLLAMVGMMNSIQNVANV